ncbi:MULTISPECIES: sensor histidine kinase [unclassified Luteococcus]|uniref:sensor histidine kinase n=1 Tax=unclassified Luteococcus TaxID=2639923 RepID=UPI00313BCE2B
MARRSGSSLLWRVMLTNGLILGVATAALAFSPATVSAQPLASEVVVLGLGIALMLLANVLVLRRVLGPLDQLVAFLGRAQSSDLLGRVPEPPEGLPRDVARSVNGLLGRIEDAQRRSAAAALAAQESERSRIAQDLHDGLGQELTALVLEADVLANRAVRLADEPAADVRGQARMLAEQAQHLREVARLGLDEVHRVARQLRPGVLEDLGLRSALASLGNELFTHSETRVERRVTPDLPQLDDSQELVIFRVAQEALTNVARHAHARTVQLELAATLGAVVLTVADDGVGLGGSTPGSGISGMTERAQLVGGRLDIEEAADGGTVVRLTIPLESAQEAPR